MESFKIVGVNFRGLSNFTDSWGRNFVDRLVGEKWGGGLKGKITSRKLI